MKRLKGVLGVILIFLFGVVVGGILVGAGVNTKLRQLIEGGSDKVVEAVAERLHKELKLDGQQYELLKHIVRETQIKLGGIRQQTQPQTAAALAEAEQKVRGILRPDQVRRFDEIVKKGHERWKEGK